MYVAEGHLWIDNMSSWMHGRLHGLSQERDNILGALCSAAGSKASDSGSLVPSGKVSVTVTAFRGSCSRSSSLLIGSLHKALSVSPYATASWVHTLLDMSAPCRSMVVDLRIFVAREMKPDIAPSIVLSIAVIQL